jgi:hypothetical protein
MKKRYGVYWIAFKLLLRKGDRFLFLITSKEGRLDLPGGRADIDEVKVPLLKILGREVREELGNNIKYKLRGPLFQYRRHNREKKNIYNLITVYKAEYIKGSIKLSREHSSCKWINPKKYKFKEKQFFNKEEYKAFKEYFEGKK